jgi:predicted dehydrogenase
MTMVGKGGSRSGKADDRLKVGIIGFGKMGQTRAKAALAQSNTYVTKVYDVQYDEEPDYQKAASIQEIVEDPDIDAVFICLPNFLNKSTTIAALQNGKHVFCEKPPAFTGDDVREIMAVEKASGRKLMYGFNHRHHAAVVKMKEIIDGGEYGRVLWMRGRYGKSVDANYLKTWRANPQLSGGGILIDQGIHMLDLFLHLGGTFDDIHAFVSNRFWKTPGIEDNVFAIFRNNTSGMVASFHSTMTQWRHLFSLEVFLESGYLVLNGLKTSSKSYGEEVLTIAKNRTVAPAATWSDEEQMHFQYDVSWEAEVRLFINAIVNDEPVTSGTSQQALDVMTMIDRIYAEQPHQADILHTDLIPGGAQ